LTVADIQRVLLSVRGQAGAEARWKKRDNLDEALLNFKPDATGSKERYANDPLGMG
jgi:hypothetical protein